MNRRIFFCLISILLVGCTNVKIEVKADPEQEKTLLKETIENTIGWAREKDTALLYSIIAADDDYLEVHPENSVVIGIKQFKEAESFWLDDRFQNSIMFTVVITHIMAKRTASILISPYSFTVIVN